MTTILDVEQQVSREDRRKWNQRKCFAAVAAVWRWDEMHRWNSHISSDTSEWRLPTNEQYEYRFYWRSKWMRRRAVELMIGKDISRLKDQWERLLHVMPSGVRKDLASMASDFADWMSVKMSVEDMNRRNNAGMRLAGGGAGLVLAEEEDTFSMVDVNAKNQDFDITPLEDWSLDSDLYSDSEEEEFEKQTLAEAKERIKRNGGLPEDMKRYKELSDKEVYSLELMKEVKRWRASRFSSPDPMRSCLSRWEGTREAREKRFFAKETKRRRRYQKVIENYRKAMPVTRRVRKKKA